VTVIGSHWPELEQRETKVDRCVLGAFSRNEFHQSLVKSFGVVYDG